MEKSRRCKQCGETKSEAAFLPIRQRHIRVVICDPCVQANMAKWARTQNVGLRPDQVKEIAD